MICFNVEYCINHKYNDTRTDTQTTTANINNKSLEENYMKKIIFTLDNCNEDDIRSIERVLGLREGTIDTRALSERVSDMRDFYVQIGFVDYARNSE